MMGAWRAAALAAEFGFAVVGSLVGGVLVGQFLDRQLRTAPVFFFVGLVLGFVASIYLMYAIYLVQVQPSRRLRQVPSAALGGRARRDAPGPAAGAGDKGAHGGAAESGEEG